jgi:autotransporter adhesin
MSNIGFLMQPRARFNDFIQLFGNSMNKSYRSLWNESLGAWVAASELTRAGGKRSGARVVAAVIVAAAAWGGLSGVASAAVIGAPVQAQDGNYSSGAASATGEDSTAVGAGSKASAQGTTAVGGAAKASAVNATGLVRQAAAGENVTVAKGLDGMAVDFTGTGTDGARKLIGVADGAVNATSREAVNGSQLNATNQNVAANTTAISSIDGRVTTNTNDIAALMNGSDTAVRQAGDHRRRRQCRSRYRQRGPGCNHRRQPSADQGHGHRGRHGHRFGRRCQRHP